MDIGSAKRLLELDSSENRKRLWRIQFIWAVDGCASGGLQDLPWASHEG
jgi:hypothetical protein